MSAPDPAQNVPYAPDLHTDALYSVNLTVRPSSLDPQDYLDALPTRVTLPPWYALSVCADPLDQSQLGACTANGMDGMWLTENLLAGKPAVPLSRLALYYAERLAEGSVASDSGAMPRDGLLVMKNQGVGREDLWPYDITKFTDPPPAAEVADAPRQKIAAFYRISGLTGVKTALMQHHPVGMAMLCFSGIMRSRNGVIPMPSPGEQPEGGHWVYLRGWQDRPDWPGGGYLIIRNSWGSAAGNGHGDYFIPYAYAGNTQLVSEFWRIQLP